MLKLIPQIFLLLFLAGCSSSKKANFSDYIFQHKKEKNSYVKSYNNSLKLWKIPFEEQNIKTRYGTAHVIITGPENGKKLVLLHGMDASSTMWYPNIKALSKNHRVFAIDFLMEPSKSTLTTNPLSSEEIVIWYNDIFNYYKIKNFDIVAASRGGWIATLLATKNNTIEKIVLLSPAQTFEFVDNVRRTSSALLLKFFPSEKKLGKTLKAFSTHPEKMKHVFKRQFYLANKYAKSNTNMLQMLPFSDSDLKLITNPVLVLIGDDDVINSEKTLERVQKLLPKGKTGIIKDAGHFLSIDQSNVVNEAIISFIE